jgi:hypothetical protein
VSQPMQSCEPQGTPDLHEGIGGCEGEAPRAEGIEVNGRRKKSPTPYETSGGLRLALRQSALTNHPPWRDSIALRVSVSASPSRSASTASVVLLRVPFGFPAGLPLCPG